MTLPLFGIQAPRFIDGTHECVFGGYRLVGQWGVLETEEGRADFIWGLDEVWIGSEMVEYLHRWRAVWDEFEGEFRASAYVECVLECKEIG